MDKKISSHSSHVTFTPTEEEDDEEERYRNEVKNEIVNIIVKTLELIPTIAETLVRSGSGNTSSSSLRSDKEEYYSKESLTSTKCTQTSDRDIIQENHSGSFIEGIIEEVLDRIQSKTKPTCKSSSCSKNFENETTLRWYIEGILSECFDFELSNKSNESRDKFGRPVAKCVALDNTIKDSSNELFSITFDSNCKQKVSRCVQTCEDCRLDEEDVERFFTIIIKMFDGILNYLKDKSFRVFFGPSLDETTIASIAYAPYAPAAYRRMKKKLQALFSRVDQSCQSIPNLVIRIAETVDLYNEDIVELVLIAHKAVQTDCGC